MPQVPNPVNPGDLITAQFFNNCLNVLNDLETRVAKLEAVSTVAAGVVINSVVPSGSVHVGDELDLIGRGFGIATQNSVTIGGQLVSSFLANSSDTLLKLTVPTIQNVPSQGMIVSLILSNPNGSPPPLPLFVLPAQPALPTGQLFLAMSQPPQVATVQPGDLVFGFTITGTTSLADTYTVTPQVDVGWTAVLVDNSSPPKQIIPSQIQIPQGNTGAGVNATFNVKVTVPGGTAAGVTGQLRVSVASQQNPANLNAQLQGPLALTVNSPPPGAQNAIIISFNQVFAPGSTSPVQGGQPGALQLNVPVSGTPAPVAVQYNVALKTPGTYNIGLPTFLNATGWSAAIGGNGQATINAPSANFAATVTFNVSAAAGAAATTMNFTITSGATPSVSSQFQQQVSPT